MENKINKALLLTASVIAVILSVLVIKFMLIKQNLNGVKQENKVGNTLKDSRISPIKMEIVFLDDRLTKRSATIGIGSEISFKNESSSVVLLVITNNKGDVMMRQKVKLHESAKTSFDTSGGYSVKFGDVPDSTAYITVE